MLLPPLSLYIHLPWCVRKCPYCNFNSHEAREAVPEAAYVDALLADLESELPRVWGRRLESVFLGAARRACSRRRPWTICSRNCGRACPGGRTWR